ncbi:MAG: hypothetical protein KF883_05090 [Thermomicrobiales bacterium]|nr:hypothetical protein [Thermomicrobiales bacterium]
MKIVETRLLEGPNIFMLEPAVKIEFDTGHASVTDDDLADVQELAQRVEQLHADAGQARPAITIEAMEVDGHISLAFGWTNRRFARLVCDVIASEIDRGSAALSSAEIGAVLDENDPSDAPEMIGDAARSKLAIGVTGTNGKTTTTRLIAHIFRHAGRHVGWSCSSGVYIEGEEVLSGDYSGPRGAQRVLNDPEVEVGVVELARGGILLRGISTQSLDVSVFTNISADHLDLQGIRTVEGLARSKAVVSRITRPGGFAVVNADDPLVMHATEDIRAQRVLVSQQPENPALTAHIAGGGKALVNTGGAFVFHDQGDAVELCRVDEIPMTFRGTAGFMVENSLCGAAAALMGGLSIDEVRAGLQTFDNSGDKNPGRLNVYAVNGVTIVVDFAHNEAGLLGMLTFARSFAGAGGKIYSVVGTAGDRTDESIRELGRIAAMWSDHIVAKDTEKYLRGRKARDLMDLYALGYQMAEGTTATYEEAESELAGVEKALSNARRGDVVAIMSHESAIEIRDLIIDRGGGPI